MSEDTKVTSATWQASLPPSLVPAQIICAVMALFPYAALHCSLPTISTLTLLSRLLADPPWLV